MAKILVTGGAGYIGTHVLCTLAAAGHRAVCIDNYVNSSPVALERVERIAPGAVEAHEIDIREREKLERLFATHPDLEAVIHLAGLKAVGESVEQPDRYEENNVGGTRVLLEALAASKVRKFVFSSSATVYGLAQKMPVDESTPTDPQSPYGQNKLDIERLLADLARREPAWRIANLRYFNPVGAHTSGLIGENPRGAPNNLMPYICQAAAGQRAELSIFGNDYPTRDGTGVRDYIHVLDLADGHLAALDALQAAAPGSVTTANLGTGQGWSVLELIEAFERVNGVAVPRRIVARRPGDIAVCYADAGFAKRRLRWAAARGIEDMCRDAWRWQRMNPAGY
jgi:UDP-glucose 4-epimerase